MRWITLSLRPSAWYAVSLIAFAQFGCAGGHVGAPPTVPVSGMVTYNGEPVADATVSFHPQGDHRSAYAKTDAAGAYRLTTVHEHDGAMLGEYQVTVSKIIDENAVAPTNDIAAVRPTPKYTSMIPEKYGKPTTSGLSASVEKGSPNQFDFTLSD